MHNFYTTENCMYRQIPVYKAEAEAGLSEAIAAKENCAVATYCPVILDDKVFSGIMTNTYAKNQDQINQSVSDSQEQFDLYYLHTILATTGWNKNDDVFDRQEMWSARHTAEDKPFNKGHDPNYIIGHITGNAVVDENYELVSDDSDIDSLPKKFHILTSAVMYKHISSRDEKLSLSMQELIREIAEGKWYVSMEALFSNFDYALIADDGSERIVSRNEDTAFLSKHLRSYGGAGEYEGMKVGRLMRNMTFSGKGLVENPGNPESIIFKEEDSFIFQGAASSFPEISLLVTSSKGDSSMSEHNEQVRSLEAQVETLEVRLKELDEEKVRAQISTFEKACADKDAEITELKERLAAAAESIGDYSKSSSDFDAAKAESDKVIAELTEKLDAIEADSLKTSRISSLVDKGVDKSEAESLVETFSGITDEQFDALVAKFSEAAWPPGKNGEEDKKKKKKKEDEADKEAEAEEAAEAADEAEDAEVLEEAQAEEETTPLAAQSEDNTEVVVSSLNDYFSEVLSGTNNEKDS
jgi:hypothetical protein